MTLHPQLRGGTEGLFLRTFIQTPNRQNTSTAFTIRRVLAGTLSRGHCGAARNLLQPGCQPGTLSEFELKNSTDLVIL